MLVGAVAGAATGVVMVQVLGLLDAISPLTLGLALALSIIAGGTAALADTGSHPAHETTGAPRAAMVAVAGILGVTLLLALLSPPNTSDAMSYHLPRVLHWLDRGTLAPYFTGIDRQLWQPPFAEFLVALGYGATGRREWLVNVPEWLAFAGLVLVAMEIARVLGADRRGRWTASVIAATIPPAILQASSAQNDLLATFWLLVVAWLALGRWAGADAVRVLKHDAVLLGIATALAVGTKGTTMLLVAPWLVLFLAADARRGRWRTVLRHAAVVLAVVTILNARHWAENTTVFDTAFGPSTVQRVLRPASLSLPVVASNLAANLSLHAGTPFAAVNDGLLRGMAGFNTLLGVSGERLYPYFGGFRIDALSTHEDLAGAPLHLLLGLAALLVAAARWRRLTALPRAGVLALAATWLLFAAAVRWQPFNARLHLPMLAAMAPFLALWLTRVAPVARTAVLGTLLLAAMPPLLGNATRPLVPQLTLSSRQPAGSILSQDRASAYFNDRPALEPSYRALVENIRRTGCDRIGIVAGYDSWEYPLWALTRTRDTRFTHVPTTTDHSEFCAVAALEPDFRLDGGRQVWSDGVLSLWRPEGTATPEGAGPR